MPVRSSLSPQSKLTPISLPRHNPVPILVLLRGTERLQPGREPQSDARADRPGHRRRMSHGQLALCDPRPRRSLHRAALRVLAEATGGSGLYRPPSLRLRAGRRRAQPARVGGDRRRLRGADVDRLRHRLRAPVGATSPVARPADRLRPLPQEGREGMVPPTLARSEIDHPGGGRGAHRDPLCGHRLPARCAARSSWRSSASNSSPRASGGVLHPRFRSSFRW